MNQKALYYIAFSKPNAYVTCTYSDGSIRTWNEHDKGYKSALARALKEQNRNFTKLSPKWSWQSVYKGDATD
jgi:hypothetical protein